MNSSDLLAEVLLRAMPKVDDHPDIAGLFRDPEILPLLGPALAYPLRGLGVEVVLGPEARGFALGTLVAAELGVGLMLARKAGTNHPGADVQAVSSSTWKGRSETFLLRSFDIGPGRRFAVVDDWITTGNSTRALRDAAVGLGGVYVGCSAIVNKATPATIAELAAHTVVDFDRL